MKRLFCIYLLSFITTYSFSQYVVVSPKKFKTLYYNFDNPVEIVASNYNCDDLIIKTKKSIIKRIDSCNYIIRPFPANTETITVYKKTNNDTVPIDTLNFVIKGFPLPTATIEKPGEDKAMTIPNKLNASIKNSDYEIKYTVVSYSIKLFRKYKMLDSAAVDSNIIDDRFEKILSKAKSGDKIYFDNIMVKREDGIIIGEINSIYIKVSK